MRKRSVHLLRKDELPHRDPYLYVLDGQTVGTMQHDLLDPSWDVGPETEKLLARILGSF